VDGVRVIAGAYADIAPVSRLVMGECAAACSTLTLRLGSSGQQAGMMELSTALGSGIAATH
jgi:hypothetical protein